MSILYDLNLSLNKPGLVTSITTASIPRETSARMTASADLIDISLSLDKPPDKTPTLPILCVLFILLYDFHFRLKGYAVNRLYSFFYK